MNNERRKEFTRRPSQCNAGGMIVIIYDILFVYLDDAKAAYESGDREAMKAALRNAQNVLDRLTGSLNFAYEVSKQLYAIYMFCKSEMARTMYQNSMDGADEARKLLERLYSSFVEAAKQDRSRPLMANAQQVYAGMTYGRTALNECYVDMNYQRGFSA